MARKTKNKGKQPAPSKGSSKVAQPSTTTITAVTKTHSSGVLRVGEEPQQSQDTGSYRLKYCRAVKELSDFSVHDSELAQDVVQTFEAKNPGTKLHGSSSQRPEKTMADLKRQSKMLYALDSTDHDFVNTRRMRAHNTKALLQIRLQNLQSRAIRDVLHSTEHKFCAETFMKDAERWDPKLRGLIAHDLKFLERTSNLNEPVNAPGCVDYETQMAFKRKQPDTVEGEKQVVHNTTVNTMLADVLLLRTLLHNRKYLQWARIFFTVYGRHMDEVDKPVEDCN